MYGQCDDRPTVTFPAVGHHRSLTVTNYTTEIAVLRVLSDPLKAVDKGDLATVVLLDLSAAFNTVDHSVLCQRLELTFGLRGPVLIWFQSYL